MLERRVRSSAIVCGRFSNTLGSEEIAKKIGDQLGISLRGSAGTKVLNIAPTEQVLAFVGQPPEARLLRWALLPDWADDLKGRPHINARLESVAKSGKFIGVPADANHRALIVADEFLEWSKAEQKGRSRPAPFGFSLTDGEPFCFAGLWSVNQRIAADDGGQIASCTILTCDGRGNKLVAPLHDRMPVMLADPQLWRAWLDPDVSAEEALALCEPLPAERMRVQPLPQTFNDARNKQPFQVGREDATASQLGLMI